MLPLSEQLLFLANLCIRRAAGKKAKRVRPYIPDFKVRWRAQRAVCAVCCAAAAPLSLLDPLYHHRALATHAPTTALYPHSRIHHTPPPITHTHPSSRSSTCASTPAGAA